MFEVTVFESGFEVGTFDWDVVPVKGIEVNGMKILSVEADPESGEDYAVSIEYV